MMEENLTVLSGENDSLLYDHLVSQARPHFDARREAVAQALESPDKLRERQVHLRKTYAKLLGGISECQSQAADWPLNPQVTGVIECEDYRIENVAYESRPNFHVTANLYVPTTGEKPYPAVLVPCGHTFNGKTNETYQSVAILLAKNGFVALVNDPICQGERFQFLDEDGKLATQGGTTTHTLLDIGARLGGTDVTAYELWDNIRSLDYLVSRPEVDATRLGCTGNSGGGTQTMYLMAFDERVAVAAPSCFVMTRERLFDTIGPQDGCQQLADEVGAGLEHADYITMRAPKPTLILAADQDFFDIEGVREAFAEAQQVYDVLDAADRVAMFSYDDTHGFSKPRRQVMVQWMRRWFYGDDRPVIEPELAMQEDQALWATKTGQSLTQWDDEITVMALNLTRARSLAPERERFWAEHTLHECLIKVKQLIGLYEPSETSAVEQIGVVQRDGYCIEKLVLRGEDAFPISGLIFVPDSVSGKTAATLYVDGRGKDADIGDDGPIVERVRAGQIVFSIDVRGFGETIDDPGKNYASLWNREYRCAAVAAHIDRSLLGQRVGDVLAALNVLTAREDVNPQAIHLVGIGRAGPVALHAAALEASFSALTLRDAVFSWLDVIAEPLIRDQMSHVVPNALLCYDLPDLVRVIAPRSVIIAQD